MNKITLYTVTHKKAPLVKNNIFQPIQVGAAHNDTLADYISDNTGDNISEKNPNFCELTALYWIWKNDKTSDIIGLCHYRRYFDFNASIFQNPITKIDKDDPKKGLKAIFEQKNLDHKISDLLLKYDIIVPAKKLCKINRITPVSIANEYKFSHIHEDYYIMIDVLKDLFGDEMDYDFYFRRNYKLIHYNMMICQREIFIQYCEWLFKIMDELEKRIKISEYTAQARVFGYISERLFTLYMHLNNYKVKYMPVLFIENI